MSILLVQDIDPSMDFPQDFRCPISMEVMKDPVTISTGVTYERKNIEKWVHAYKKKTCPATMQSIDNMNFITPNHTLKRLIISWENGQSSPPPQSTKHDELLSLIKTVESTPFKVSSLKKLGSIMSESDVIKADFIRSGGVDVLVGIIINVVLNESFDFANFTACEAALGVLHILPLCQDDENTTKLLNKRECIKSMAIMLQRGSAEARFYTITIFTNMARSNPDYDWNIVVQDHGIGFLKSLLELVSDEISTKASLLALQLLIEILTASKKSRFNAIEAGAICVLVELLPDANRSKCEKILLIIKLLCGCAEGRLALAEHGLGIAAVSKKLLQVSETATKVGVKILWLICSFHPTQNVLEEMLICRTVKKLLALSYLGGRSSTKDRVVEIFKLHANSWKRYPCFPSELKDYLGLA